MVKKYNPEYENVQRYVLAKNDKWYPKTNKLNKAAKRQNKLVRKAKHRARLLAKGKLNPLRTYYLYALELEDGCYYVGVTAYKNAIRRFEQHCAGKGAKWTILHKPVRIIEVRNIGAMKQSEACKKEDIMAREYIIIYGLEYVRGGDLCMINLDILKKKYEKPRYTKVPTL